MKRSGKFVVEDGSDSGFLAKNLKLLSMIAVAAIVVVAVVVLSIRCSRSRASARAEKTYSILEGYYSLSSGSSEDEIRSALSGLIAGESAFSAGSPERVRMDFLKADLYGRLEDSANRIECLESVVANAKKDNYLLAIALYDLAIAYEREGDAEKASENYERLYDTYGAESELSDRSLFALYRIWSARDQERADGYKRTLEEEFPDSEYAKFLLSLS